MKPGNLRKLKVPNPAVRRKMRLKRQFWRALSGTARVFLFLRNPFRRRDTRAYRTRLAGDAAFGRREAPLRSAQGVFAEAKPRQKRLKTIAQA